MTLESTGAPKGIRTPVRIRNNRDANEGFLPLIRAASFPFYLPTDQMPAGAAIDMREGTLLRYGIWDDWLAIDSLRKQEGDALGFVPKACYEAILKCEPNERGDRYWLNYNVLVTIDNDDLTGFCYVSYAGPLARIFQIVVRPDARRWHRALLMADAVEKKARETLKAGITCRVAIDLESNLFWSGIGFAIEFETTSTWLNQREADSKRPLYVYRKYFHNTALLGGVS